MGSQMPTRSRRQPCGTSRPNSSAMGANPFCGKQTHCSSTSLLDRTRLATQLKAQRPCGAVIVERERQQPTGRVIVRAGIPFRRLLAYSMNPDHESSRWRDISAFACADLEHQPICCLAQRIARRRELALLVLEAVAVIFVERERP